MPNFIKWILVVDDFKMHRQPQTIREYLGIEAPHATDAIEIGKIRHNFPYRDIGPDYHERRLVNVL